VVIQKAQFVNNFLEPISKLGESVKLVSEKERIYAILNSSDNTIVLLAEYKQPVTALPEEINVPDIKKFLRLLLCVPEDKNGVITLTKDKNKVTYKSPQFSFNYFLIDNAYVPRVQLSVDKIAGLTYTTTFTTTGEKLVETLKLSSITTDTEKVYLSTNGTSASVDLNDLEKHNITNASMLISNNVVGDAIDPIPLSLSNLRLLTIDKTSVVKVSINKKLKLVCFDVTSDSAITNLKYIVFGLVK
jgi:hypothetical protein